MGGGNTSYKHRPKIAAKILFYFVVIGLLPLIIVSFVLIILARDQLSNDPITKQQAMAVDLSRHVDDYLTRKTSLLGFTAMIYANDPKQIDQGLNTLLKQDPSLEKVVVLTTDGTQRIATKQNEVIKTVITRIKSDDSTLDTLLDKKKILMISRGINDEPLITVGLPIAAPSASTNSKDRVIGGIVGYYRIDDAWHTVLPDKKETGAYAYVVDEFGNLVYHPDKNFLSTHANLKDTAAVQNFLGLSYKTQPTVSETGQQVLSTPSATQSGWGVIVEEPTVSVYAKFNTYIQTAATFATLAVTFSILGCLFFSRRISRPIKQLAFGARRLAQGGFNQKIDVRTKDELQEVADVLNGMSTNINSMVTSLKANNDDLTFEQSKLRSIINSVSDGVIAVNRRGEIISVNLPAAKLVNLIPYALKGKSVSAVFPWKQESNPLQLSFLHTGIQNYTDITLAKDESIAYLDLTVEVLDDDTDVAAIITIHDQTATRELSFMKLDFVAIAAHELRTPLTVISGYLDMLNTEALHELSVMNLESLQRAIVGAGQLRALINKLLNIARIERGDMEIFIEKLNLTQLVSGNVEEHLAIAKQKDQELTYTSNTTSTVYAPADPASIVEVLNNLIGNALKYTPKNGHIQVNLIANTDHIRVEVVDDGPGIPEELRDKLFTKFYRAERSLIAGTRGTGLGLFISRTIIDLQHGTIGIEPNADHGSTFYFTLPVYDAARDDELVAKNISGGIHGWFKKRTNN